MIYPKRLIEVDLPIARISAHARREKSIQHGLDSTLHPWWIWLGWQPVVAVEHCRLGLEVNPMEAKS